MTKTFTGENKSEQFKEFLMEHIGIRILSEMVDNDSIVLNYMYGNELKDIN